jgi:hypothetical protein
MVCPYRPESTIISTDFNLVLSAVFGSLKPRKLKSEKSSKKLLKAAIETSL